MLFQGTPWPDLEILLAADQSPTIFYCPPKGHSLHLGRPKEEFVRRLIQLIDQYFADTVLWSPGVNFAGRRVILDLVDPRDRSAKVAFAIAHGDQVAAILTVGMYREGADWVQAQRVIDLIPSKSDQDRNQRFGRLLRDCVGKKHITYYSFYPCSPIGSVEQRRQCLTNLFAHFQATLILDNACTPLKIAAQRPSVLNSSGNTKRSETIDYLGQLNGQMQQEILADAFQFLIELGAKAERRGKGAKPIEVKAAILEAIDLHGVKENRSELAQQIILLLRRHRQPNTRISKLVAAGFDKVWSVEALEGLKLFSSGISGAKTFEELRLILSTTWEQRWHETYQRLLLQQSPPSSDSPDYWWVTHNKVLHSEGTLSQDCIDLLEQISWWKWQDPFKDRWHSRCEEISQHLKCPKAGTPSYNWIRQQRRLYWQGKLPADKVAACEAISWWTWQTVHDKWMDDYERIKAGRLPQAPSADYDWVKYQRRRKAEGKLDQKRRQLLEAIPWWTWNA